MFTSQKSAAIILASIFFGSVEMLATQQPSHALGDIQVQVRCTAPLISFGTYVQNCTESTYEYNGGNGNGNNVNTDARSSSGSSASGDTTENSVGKGSSTIRTGAGGGYRLIRVRRFQRRV
jgi:hypothetical protein